MKKILGLMRRAIQDYNMVEEGDKILVGVSGGKDSMVLLYALSAYQKFCPVHFDLAAVHMSMGFDDSDDTAIREFCEEIKVDYHKIDTNIGKIVFDVRKEKNPCALCARMRRGALHNEVKNMGFNKIALGHHADDALETLFMAMLYEGRVSTFKPNTYLSRKEIHNIRPFIYVTEKQIQGLVNKKNIPVVKSPCPADKETKRQEIKELLSGIYKENPKARERLMTAIQNEENFQLWF